MPHDFYEVKTTRTIKIEECVYELPEWVEFVTRDDAGKPIFGWECKPTLGQHRFSGYYTPEGKRDELKLVSATGGIFFIEL